ncbi:MAG TPA: hypothetical protein VF337_04980 [Candidatus Limnocylindrales bacterium]
MAQRFFGGGAGGAASMITPEVSAAADHLAEVAIGRVQGKSGGVRVEDYVTVLAALTGEAALVAAELFDIETTTITPGAAVFGDRINEILTGDQPDATKVPADSVVGILVGELVPGTVALDPFLPLDEFYARVAANVGEVPWGNVATSVPEDNTPGVVPLQVAFELRDAVDSAQSASGLPRSLRHVVCAVALAEGLKQVKAACDMNMAVTLAMEVAFGMSKMAPMSRAAFEEVRRARGDPGTA